MAKQIFKEQMAIDKSAYMKQSNTIALIIL